MDAPRKSFGGKDILVVVGEVRKDRNEERFI